MCIFACSGSSRRELESDLCIGSPRSAFASIQGFPNLETCLQSHELFCFCSVEAVGDVCVDCQDWTLLGVSWDRKKEHISRRACEKEGRIDSMVVPRGDARRGQGMCGWERESEGGGR